MDKTLQCVVVTPERAEIDEPAQMVILPMIDGEVGIQAGHTPLMGRVGKGELRLNSSTGVRKFRIEGGFAQVSENVVTVLTTKVERI